MTDPQRKPFLYVVVCAAGIAGDVGKLIDAAHERSWDIGVVATPQGFPSSTLPRSRSGPVTPSGRPGARPATYGPSHPPMRSP